MSTAAADAGYDTAAGQSGASQPRRSAGGKMPAGVAGGTARYLNADVTLVPRHHRGTGPGHRCRRGPLPRRLAAYPADGDGQSAAAAWLAGRRYRYRYR